MVTDADGSTCVEVTNSGVYHFSEAQQVCALKSSKLTIINSTTRLNTFSTFLSSLKDQAGYTFTLLEQG